MRWIGNSVALWVVVVTWGDVRNGQAEWGGDGAAAAYLGDGHIGGNPPVPDPPPEFGKAQLFAVRELLDYEHCPFVGDAAD